MRYILVCWLLGALGLTKAQVAERIVKGRVSDEVGTPLFLVSISVEGTRYGTVTDEEGGFELRWPASSSGRLVVSFLGYESQVLNPDSIQGGRVDIHLKTDIKAVEAIQVYSDLSRSGGLTHLETRSLEYLPNPSGNIETLLKTLPGVASNNELSSQYSVRGGNFDENLVYVNDIEVFRPLLIRSGQQEGLSFVNSDMVSSVKFSAGGFDASYGDKMSSVLDIQYNKPKAFSGSASASLLGASLHFQDVAFGGKLTHNTGIRYKTSKYLLGSLQTKGEYNPTYIDVQTYLTYAVASHLSIEFLGNYALNQYDFVPENRTTTFGTIQNALSLKMYYDGRENDKFQNLTGALKLRYRPTEVSTIDFTLSGFRSLELERYDIQAEYLLNELDMVAGSPTQGDSILNLGVGTLINHARNRLQADVYSASLRGSHLTEVLNLSWGTAYQYEAISDKLSEWEMVDSAGFTLPVTDEGLYMYTSVKARNQITNQRLTAFAQANRQFTSSVGKFFLSGGLRINYTQLNNQTLASPRLSFSYKPLWKRDILFRISGGYYYQPPFYKEMRDSHGQLHTDLKAQQSIHLLGGMDYNFIANKRPFRFTTELYYKALDHIVPYKAENVKVQYYPGYDARGYAMGMDFKVNGEFVQNAESWVSLSLLRTQEDIKTDYYYKYYNQDGVLLQPGARYEDPVVTDSVRVEPGFYPRPTDQWMNFNLFFQDYFPNSPDWKVHLNLNYGSRLPFSHPKTDRQDLVYRMPAYRRVDLGISKSLKLESRSSKVAMLNTFRSIWVSLEVFNLLDFNNTVSYLWVKTVGNQQGVSGEYAVPNYLTSRRINLRLTANF